MENYDINSVKLFFEIVLPLQRVELLTWGFYLFSFIVLLLYMKRLFKRSGFFSSTMHWLLISICIPFYIVFLCAFSDLNAFASPKIVEYYPSVNEAFRITIVGLVCFMVANLFFFNSVRINFGLVSKYSWVVRGFFLKRSVLLLLYLLFLALFLFMHASGAPFGGLREFSMQESSFRPAINAFQVLYPLVLSVVLVKAYMVRTFQNIMISLFYIGLALDFGTRSAIFWPLLNIVFIAGILRKQSVNLKVIILGLMFLLMVVAMGMLREGSDLSGGYAVLLNIFYGNSFSDLRDFAWVLHYWDGNFLYGKTQLSGMMSLVPASLSEFRQQWGWGHFTSRVTGLDGDVHPGLRPGPFGEFYFNFGMPGVVVIAIIHGFILAMLDKVIVSVERCDYKIRVITIFSSLQLAGLAGSLLITAGFFIVYVYLVIFAAGAFFIHVSSRLASKN